MTPVRIFRRSVLAAAAVLLVCGCGRQAVGADVAATIDGEGIAYPEFEAYLRDNVDAGDLPLAAAVLGQLFDQVLDERLLVRLARERGQAQDGDARVDHRAAVAYLLRRSRPEPPTEGEVAAYYRRHLDDFRRQESVRLRQILVHGPEDAEAAVQALRRGQGFDQVAARFSQVPMAQLGDEGGRLTRDDLPAAFADSIFELEPGEISEILPAEYGFHIFQVVERFPADEAPLSEVAAEIRRVLEQQGLDEMVASFVAEARGRYNVKIHRSNFPFDYRGSYVQKEHE